MGIFKGFIKGGIIGVASEVLKSRSSSSSSSMNSFSPSPLFSPSSSVPFIINGPIGEINRVITEKTFKTIKEKMSKVDTPLAEKVKKSIENIENWQRTLDNGKDSLDLNKRIMRLLAKEDTNLLQADHLYVQRSTYTHHGLYLGGGEVIHYLRGEGITTDSIETFANGAQVFVKKSLMKYNREIVIGRAFTRLGENQYNLASNNCEHYVCWCRNGD